jgi:hypothetical protein
MRRTSRIRIALSAALVATMCGAAQASDYGQFDLTLDVRAVASDGRRTFLDAGLGKLRFDDGDDGLQLGRARLAWRNAVGESWHASVDASAWNGDDHNAIDLTEAFLEWRPVPQSAWRQRAKIGAFYAPISLEHRAAGWTNPYFHSSSALNTWVGEELRTIGAEYRLEYSGAGPGADIDVGVGAAVYGWNDPAGIIIGTRGWALHDRQTPLFGRIGTLPLLPGPEQRVIFEEIDDRPGYYVHGYARQADRLELRALWYDNRADPASFDAGINDYGWETRFVSLGARYETATQTTLIAQWLNGSTFLGDNRHDRWTFDAAFVLVAQQWRQHRFAARIDRFGMEHNQTIFPVTLGLERGDAWSLAWTWQARPSLEISAEWLEVDSDMNWRLRLGEAPEARERSLQLGLRYSWSSAGR